MHSPKYAIRREHLDSLFIGSELKRIWKEKVRASLRSSLLRDPLDHLDFHLDATLHCNRIAQLVLDGEYQPTSPIRVRVEKSKGLCRQIVIPSVQDAIVLQRLSDALYAQIKDQAPTKKAFFEPQDHSFSNKKLAPPEYGSFRAWLNFQQELFAFAKERDFIVVTDIANFYDFISYQHLRNLLSSLVKEKETILDLLIYTLSGMLWQPDYMPRTLIGLPQIDIDAPRILAHCFLYEVDEFLAKHTNYDHARFMDDIDIGVDTIVEAKRALRDVDSILQTRQVRLNSGKTQILTRAEAFEHFRIRQNHTLDRLVAHLHFKIEKGIPLTKEQKQIPNLVKRYQNKKRFDGGNGEKILKRLISICNLIDAQIDPALLKLFLLVRPNVREAALNHYARRKGELHFLRFLADQCSAGTFVDDAALIHIARTVFVTRYTYSIATKNEGLRLARCLAKSGDSGYIASLYLFAKFGTPEEIAAHVTSTQLQWKQKPWLGRFVAALYPYVYADKSARVKFGTLTARAKNDGLDQARFFIDQLISAQPRKEVVDYLKASNGSLKMGASLEKVGMIIAVSHNVSMNVGQRTTILAKHSKVYADKFFAKKMAAP